MAKSQLIAGVARADITPPVGMLMAGYGARKTPAVGIHDELHTVVLYLSDGETEAGLVTADLLYVNAEGAARVRDACSAASGVPTENVMVACSHTHGGPQTDLGRSDPGDGLKEAYSTVLVHKMAGALSEAKRNAMPVRMGHGRQDCSFAMNRRERKPDGTTILGVNPEGPTARFTDVIRLDRLDSGEPMALVFGYACHGTTLGGDNLLYTADHPGPAKRFIERQLPTARALFVAECSADTNPYPRETFEQCERHGRRLGCAAVQAALDIEEMVDDVRLAVARHEFALSLETPPSLDEARGRLAAAEAAAEEELANARQEAGGAPVDEGKALSWFTARTLRGARELVAGLERGETDLTIPVEAQALALGDCAIVGLPGEIFVNIGLAVSEGSPFARTLPLSHTNGAPGYIPTADQIPFGGYEVEQARARRYGLFIVPESDRAMVEGALVALRMCYEALNT